MSPKTTYEDIFAQAEKDFQSHPGLLTQLARALGLGDNRIAQTALGLIEPQSLMDYAGSSGGIAGSLDDVTRVLKKGAYHLDKDDISEIRGDLEGIFHKDFNLPTIVYPEAFNQPSYRQVERGFTDIYKGLDNLASFKPELVADNPRLSSLDIGVPDQKAGRVGFYINPIEYPNRALAQNFLFGSSNLTPPYQVSGGGPVSITQYGMGKPDVGQTAVHEVAHSLWRAAPPEIQSQWFNKFWEAPYGLRGLSPEEAMQALDVSQFRRLGDQPFRLIKDVESGVPFSDYGGINFNEDWAETAGRIFDPTVDNSFSNFFFADKVLHGGRAKVFVDLLKEVAENLKYVPHTTKMTPAYDLRPYFPTMSSLIQSGGKDLRPWGPIGQAVTPMAAK